MTGFLLAAAALATLAAAVIAGYENGIYGMSHVRLRYRLTVGDPGAAVLHRMLAKPQRLLTAMLLGQNIVVYFVTAVVSAVLEEWGVEWAELVSTVALAVFFFIAVEAVPKNVFRRAADTLVYVFARPMYVMLVVLTPLELALRGITALFARLGRGQCDTFSPLFTRERLMFYLREGQTEGILSRYQVELTNNILRGERVTVARAMVPMERVSAVPETAGLDEFAALAREKRFSRYPVYRGDKSTVVGVANIYDSLVPGAGGVSQVMRAAAYFAPDVHVTEALRTLRESRQAMGIVVDNGRAVGIVTMKDCMEEIVGELYAW